MILGLRNVFLALGVILASIMLVGSVAFLSVIFYYSKDLPDFHQLSHYDPATMTRLYSSDGKLLSEYASEKRLYVPITAIPKKVINAFIAAEDKNFYQHPGIDLISIIRAGMQNLANYGSNRPMVGGSTITQQVVKNFLLTNERSFNRKIKEAILSFRVSQAFSKNRILELYLNEIYLGASSYGVAVAALNYFNKSLDELSIEEAALLAGMPKAPSSYDPRNNYDRALERRNYVLNRMLEDHYITLEEYQDAVEKPITLRKRDETEQVTAEYFAEAVRRRLLATFGEENLYKGGMVVHTTLDPELQRYADAALKQGIETYDRRHGFRGPVKKLKISDLKKKQQDGNKAPYWQAALQSLPSLEGYEPMQYALVLAVSSKQASFGLKDGSKGTLPAEQMQWALPKGSAVSSLLKEGYVIVVKPAAAEKSQGQWMLSQIPKVNGGLVAIDPHTGKVLAMSGGYNLGRSQFNRVTQARRQPGSAFKPFVYLAALEQGYTPASIIIDAEIELPQGPNMPDWKPQNFSGEFYGPSTLRTGVERSRNAMTVRLAQSIGMPSIMDVAKRFHINDHPKPLYSMVLGSTETTLIDLTNAYAMVVNGGKRVRPALIEQIQDKTGATIYRRDKRICRECFFFMKRQDSNAQYTDLFAKERAAEFAASTPPVIPDIREEVTDPLTAYQLVSILEGVVQRGTGAKAKALGKILGGKTGTTNDSRDSWFMGFSPDLVVGTYIGFDEPKTLGKHETGASVALPIFMSFMQNALKDKPNVPFRIPEGIELVRIDRETGLLPSPTTPESKIIFEAFKPGTAPNAYGIAKKGRVPTLADPDVNDTPDYEEGGSNPLLGTSGIY